MNIYWIEYEYIGYILNITNLMTYFRTRKNNKSSKQTINVNIKWSFSETISRKFNNY